MWRWWCVGWYDTATNSCLYSNVCFNCIVQDPSYYNMGIGTIWRYALVSCTPSQSIGLSFVGGLFWCWVYRVLFHHDFRHDNRDYYGGPYGHSFILSCTFKLSLTNRFWFCKCATPWMFPTLDILLEYWIEHVAFGIHYGMFTFHTRISYMGVPGFAADCHCGVWCRGLTTYLLYVGPIFKI